MRATARRPASNWRSLHSPPFAMMAVENISGSHPAEVQNLGIFSLKLKKFRAVCRTGENSFSDKGGPLLQLMGALCMGNKLTLKFDSKVVYQEMTIRCFADRKLNTAYHCVN
ncbi:uncharacterized protein LOC103720422 isoform X9 [Phoenix dactylifera]|uniref:Uncharacterized protein LOC103720422 isoform X9 n=1 Tax=Phoenix dactylifera TaxID=42345 RepID=A0A8B9ATG6_PHODC|nr:uncharacterized protein LOC103720422 isoform X9 [Phoenix dactylifera]